MLGYLSLVPTQIAEMRGCGIRKTVNWAAIRFDWNLARAFLATVEEGSLSGAARALAQTQPTLSRQVTALEEQLGVVLFERGTRTMTLTAAGQELVEHVRAMADAAHRFALAASGQVQQVRGRVCITATETMAAYHLPAILQKIRAAAPELELVVTACSGLKDLLQREADIAIRHGRPEEPDLVTKRVAVTEARLYASAAYLEQLGRPSSPLDLAQAEFVGFERPDELVPLLQERGLPITTANFPVSTTSGPALVEMVARGLGVGVLLQADAVQRPELEEVLPQWSPIEVPVWLAVHRELQTSARIRLVFNMLAEELGASARVGWRAGE